MNKPNIVIINIDQLRSFTVGCYGNETIQTPHIDSLAAGGLRFEQGISNNPVFLDLKNKLLHWNRNTPWLKDTDGKVPEWRL